MGKATVWSRFEPVLSLRRDDDRIAGMSFLRRLAPLLIVSTPRRTKQALAAAMVDLPVVPAGGPETDLLLSSKTFAGRDRETPLRSPFPLCNYFCPSTSGTMLTYVLSISGVLT